MTNGRSAVVSVARGSWGFGRFSTPAAPAASPGNLLKGAEGQAMTEYVLVVGVLMVPLLAFNTLVIPALNDLYELIATLVGLPFP